MWRQIVVCLSLAGLAIAMDYENCVALECGSGTTDSNCVSVGTDKVVVTPCSSGKYCPDTTQLANPVTSWYDVSCLTTPTVNTDGEGTDFCSSGFTFTNQAAGDFCCNASDCYSNSCSSNACGPVASGETCTDNDQCDVNYYCSSGKCTEALADGSACNEDTDCRSGSGCNNAKCTKLLSLEAGVAAEDAKYCKSGATNDNICTEVEVYVNGTKLESPFECNIGDTCTFKLTHGGSNDLTRKCSCPGIADSTTGYCELYDYLYHVSGGIDQVTSEADFSAGTCYGQSPHNLGDLSTLVSCGVISEDYREFYQKIMEQYDHWALYKSGVIDSCATELQLFDPNYSADDYNFSSSLVYSLIVLVFN